MRTRFCQLMTPLLLLCVIVIGCDEDSPAISSDPLTALATNLDGLKLVTPKRLRIDLALAVDCRQPTEPPASIPTAHDRLSSSGQAEIQVYVTPEGVGAIKGNGAFSVGTVILKQKFSTPSTNKAELFTGMLKREKGFNSNCGDWEFFTLSGDGQKVTSRGRLNSCMECHKEFAKTDFVSKRYP